MFQLFPNDAESPSARFERKLTSSLDVAEVRMNILFNPSLFRDIYHQRFINNIYLDTPSLDLFQMALDGQTERVKVRVRWYGDLMGEILKPQLEVKIKRGLLGTKHTYPLIPFELDESFSRSRLQEVFSASSLPGEILESVRGLDCALLNRYRRSYFLSDDQHFRVTIDNELTYHGMQQVDNTYLCQMEHYDHTVVEVKYCVEQDAYASEVTKSLPFRVTKNSKYTQGLLFVKGEPLV